MKKVFCLNTMRNSQTVVCSVEDIVRDAISIYL